VRVFCFAAAVLSLTACRPTEPVPKPRGYARIDLPDTHQYQLFDDPAFPYAFEYARMARIGQDTALVRERPENRYWLNVDYPSLNASIYLSYNRMQGRQDLGKLLEDAHFMSFYHSKRADYVKDNTYRNEYGVTGIAYEWGGASASAYQFIATDSTRHFLRGALYFNVTPNADSLKPATAFVEEDVTHLMKTLRFRP
jgi:gliding motility-associated lipoprotein GldD